MLDAKVLISVGVGILIASTDGTRNFWLGAGFILMGVLFGDVDWVRWLRRMNGNDRPE